MSVCLCVFTPASCVNGAFGTYEVRLDVVLLRRVPRIERGRARVYQVRVGRVDRHDDRVHVHRAVEGVRERHLDRVRRHLADDGRRLAERLHVELSALRPASSRARGCKR